MTYPDYFIRRDFAFYDSGLFAVVSDGANKLFELIRRHTWRGYHKSDQAARLSRYYRYVYARVGQDKLAELSGCSRRTISRYIHELKALGWLDVVSAEDQGPAFYIVGEWVKDRQKNGTYEVFYFDSWLRELWGYLETEAYREFGQDAEARQSGEVDPTPVEHRSPVRIAPISWRIEKTKEFIKSKGVEIEETEHSSHDTDDAEQLSRDTDDVGGTSPVAQGVRHQWRSVSTEEEPENIEGREEAGPPASAASSQLPDQDFSREFGTEHAADAMERMNDLEEIRKKASKRSKRSSQETLDKAREKERKLENLNGGKESPTKQIKALEDRWRQLMSEAFPNIKKLAKWEGKERGQVRKLIDKYDYNIVMDAICYLVGKWSDLNDRILKGNGSYPTIGFLLRFHDVVAVEAQGWAKLAEVEREIKDWRRKNPMVARLPEHLREKRDRAQAAMRG